MRDKSGNLLQPGINLGELSQDSVKSLADLLYLQQIDKKLLTSLGDFFFRLSNLEDTQSSGSKYLEKNFKNWKLINNQLSAIGNQNTKTLND